MVLFYDFQGCIINCNNPLQLTTKISEIQNKYFTYLTKKGYSPCDTWSSGSTDLFKDDIRGRDPFLKPEEIEKAYLDLNERYKLKKLNLSSEITFRRQSARTYMSFAFTHPMKLDLSMISPRMVIIVFHGNVSFE